MQAVRKLPQVQQASWGTYCGRYGACGDGGILQKGTTLHEVSCWFW